MTRYFTARGRPYASIRPLGMPPTTLWRLKSNITYKGYFDAPRLNQLGGWLS